MGSENIPCVECADDYNWLYEQILLSGRRVSFPYLLTLGDAEIFKSVPASPHTNPQPILALCIDIIIVHLYFSAIRVSIR